MYFEVKISHKYDISQFKEHYLLLLILFLQRWKIFIKDAIICFKKKKIIIFICREDDEDMINDQKQKFLKKKSRELKPINDRSSSIDATQTETHTELQQVKNDLTIVSFFLSYLISF